MNTHALTESELRPSIWMYLQCLCWTKSIDYKVLLTCSYNSNKFKSSTKIILLCLYKQNNEVGIPYWYENSVLSSRRFSIPTLNVCIQKSKSRKKWSVCWRGSWKSMQHSTAVQRLIRWQLIGKKLAANCVMLPTSRGQSEKM